MAIVKKCNKNCVAYLRYSSENQSEHSIEYQRAYILDYCKRNDFVIVKEYVDEGFSATNVRRPAFQEMIKDSKNHPIWDKILVFDLSRAFRHTYDSTVYKQQLSDRGIRIISVTESFTESTDGEILEGIVDLINAQYSKDNAKRSFAGMRIKAKEAGHCGGKPPLGYDVGVDGKLVINPVEAAIVREIFALYDLGYSYTKMADYLNSKGAKTKLGGKFTKNSFYSILTQEKYIGTYRWNKRRAKTHEGHSSNSAYKPTDEQTIVKNGCPAIIPSEQFQRIQEKLKNRANGHSEAKSRYPYMLSGMKLIKCAKCGAYMTGKITISHGKKYVHYACPKHKGKVCPTKDIPAQGLDEFVANALAEMLISEDNVNSLNSLMKGTDDDVKYKLLKNRLKGVNKKIANITQSLEGGYSEALVNSLHSLEKEQLSIKQEINETNVEVVNIDYDNIIRVRKDFARYLRNSDEPEVRELLKTHIKEICIDNDKARIELVA